MNLKSLTPLPTKILERIYGIQLLNGTFRGLKFGPTWHYNTAGLAGWRISSAFTGFCPVWWFLTHVMRENRDTECGNPFPSANLTPRTVAMMASLLGCLLQPNISAGTSPSNWPQFRGPNGSGLAPDDKPAPVVFGPNKNELWHTSLLSGHSSPCIWGQRIFLTCFDETHQRVETVCLDRSSGRILWKVAAPEMVLEKGLHAFSSHASSTPATDGQRIYVYIGAYGVVAYDFDGKTVWTRSLPTPPTQHRTPHPPDDLSRFVFFYRGGKSRQTPRHAGNQRPDSGAELEKWSDDLDSQSSPPSGELLHADDLGAGPGGGVGHGWKRPPGCVRRTHWQGALVDTWFDIPTDLSGGGR